MADSFKVSNKLMQVIPILIKDPVATSGQRQILLMPKGKEGASQILTETQMSPDLQIKQQRKYITVTKI